MDKFLLNFFERKKHIMKRIAFLLALVLCFSCFTGLMISAEGEEATRSLDIVSYTVPVEAGTISIYFAVPVEG